MFLFFSCNAFAAVLNSEEMILSAPEELASLDTNLLVEGCVSVASGQLCLIETDLAIEAAQNLLLNRTYISPQVFGRYHDKDGEDRLELGKTLLQLRHKQWEKFPHLWVIFRGDRAWVSDPNGTVLEFQIKANWGILKTPPYGCSNLRGSEPTAEADIRNVEFTIRGNQIFINWPNGVQRVYDPCGIDRARLQYERLPI